MHNSAGSWGPNRQDADASQQWNSTYDVIQGHTVSDANDSARNLANHSSYRELCRT